MPKIKKALSAIDRLVFLKNAVNAAKSTEGIDQAYLRGETIARAEALSVDLEDKLGHLGKFSSESHKEVREKNEAINLLKTYVRDLWEVVKRRVYRENLPLDVFAYYQLPKSGNKPELNSDGQSIELATLIIKGDADAVSAGYNPMANPSAAELQEVLSKAAAELKDVSEADRALDLAQESVSGLMPEVKSLIDRIIAELEFGLFDRDDANKRRIMRNYGVRYAYTKNEPIEDEVDESHMD